MFKNYHVDRCYIISEIGGNFTTFDQAKRLIDEASGCGVDAVKLQTYRADTITSSKAIFDMENTGVVSQHDLFRKYEVNEALHHDVFKYAESKGLDWFSTPSHETDVELLEKCGVGAHKIGSDDAVNFPFLRYVARTGKPVLLSTGMCTLEEVRESVDAIQAEGNTQLILLHAITSYPTHPENVNLAAMKTLMQAFPATGHRLLRPHPVADRLFMRGGHGCASDREAFHLRQKGGWPRPHAFCRSGGNEMAGGSRAQF